MAKKRMGKWIDEIFDSVGRFVHLETTDGIQREGKMTGLRTKTIFFNGADQDIITEIELNGDPTDCVKLDGLAKLRIE